MKPIPESWQVNPEQCEFLGTDENGADYWCITSPTIARGVVGREVMKHQDGASRWLCSYAAWPAYTKMVSITVPVPAG